jgi:folate-dependent phosphoribosylglycinamide formyltransferase PurN
MKKILILGRKSNSTNLMFSVLKKEGFNVEFIEESRNDNSNFVKKRVKRLGVFVVISQLIFQVFSKFQARLPQVTNRLELIRTETVDSIEKPKPIKVFSNVNCSLSQIAINDFEPDCIILSGTRVLNSEFLAKVNCPIINIHAGVTPAYRGVHGGYWALATKQREYFGSTIHFVDKGIDTGGVIVHAIASPTLKDNFSTYPLLQMSAALKKLPTVLDNILKGKGETFEPNLTSAIWSHPTIWQYLFYRFKYGVK